MLLTRKKEMYGARAARPVPARNEIIQGGIHENDLNTKQVGGGHSDGAEFARIGARCPALRRARGGAGKWGALSGTVIVMGSYCYGDPLTATYIGGESVTW